MGGTAEAVQNEQHPAIATTATLSAENMEEKEHLVVSRQSFSCTYYKVGSRQRVQHEALMVEILLRNIIVILNSADWQSGTSGGPRVAGTRYVDR